MTQKILFKLLLIISTFLLAGTASSEAHTVHNSYSYHVDFDSPQSQTETLNNIQKQVENRKDNDELKIILFGHGRALSLDASALSNTKIKYENTGEAVQKKMSELNNNGVRFIICKTPTTQKRHYTTKQTSTTVEKELQRLRSQGYNCN